MIRIEDLWENRVQWKAFILMMRNNSRLRPNMHRYFLYQGLKDVPLCGNHKGFYLEWQKHH